MVSDRPSRLIRFVPDDEHTAHFICTFDEAKNILRIRKEYYDTLNEREQTIVWRATKNMTFQDVEAEIDRRRGR